MELLQQHASNETVLSAEAEESCFTLAARLRPMSSVEICQRQQSPVDFSCCIQRKRFERDNNGCKMGVMEAAHLSLLRVHFYQLMLFCSPYMKDVPIYCGLWLIWFLKVDEPLQFSRVIKSRLRHDLCLYNVTHIHTG